MRLQEISHAADSSPDAYRIFVDLDGVTADFNKLVRRMAPDYTPERYATDKQYRNEMWNVVHRYQKAGGKFWQDLDPMPDADKLWSVVGPLGAEVLTATGNPEYNAGEQKLIWVAKHLGPDIKVNLVRTAVEKAEFACPTCILIDDQEKAIKPWEAAGGIGILHTSAANTIARLRKLGL